MKTGSRRRWWLALELLAVGSALAANGAVRQHGILAEASTSALADAADAGAIVRRAAARSSSSIEERSVDTPRLHRFLSDAGFEDRVEEALQHSDRSGPSTVALSLPRDELGALFMTLDRYGAPIAALSVEPAELPSQFYVRLEQAP